MVIWDLRDALRGLIARIILADFDALEELRRPLVEFWIVQVFKFWHFIAKMLFEFSACPVTQPATVIYPVRVIVIAHDNVVVVRPGYVIV